MRGEIERKFRVDPDRWHPDPAGGVRHREGFLSVDPDRTVRVRTAGGRAWLGVSTFAPDRSHHEYEYAIPLQDANELLDHACAHPAIEMVRHRVPVGDRHWSVDTFGGANDGLIVARPELGAPYARFEPPPWIGAEVSGDPRYSSSSLVLHPYSQWGSR